MVSKAFDRSMNKPMQKLPFSISFNTDSVKLKIANDVEHLFSETKLIIC